MVLRGLIPVHDQEPMRRALKCADHGLSIAAEWAGIAIAIVGVLAAPIAFYFGCGQRFGCPVSVRPPPLLAALQRTVLRHACTSADSWYVLASRCILPLCYACSERRTNLSLDSECWMQASPGTVLVGSEVEPAATSNSGTAEARTSNSAAATATTSNSRSGAESIFVTAHSGGPPGEAYMLEPGQPQQAQLAAPVAGNG